MNYFPPHASPLTLLACARRSPCPGHRMPVAKGPGALHSSAAPSTLGHRAQAFFRGPLASEVQNLHRSSELIYSKVHRHSGLPVRCFTDWVQRALPNQWGQVDREEGSSLITLGGLSLHCYIASATLAPRCSPKTNIPGAMLRPFPLASNFESLLPNYPRCSLLQ